jgi:hypothetical protein
MSKKPSSAEDQMKAAAGFFICAFILIASMVIAGMILAITQLAKHGLLIPVGVVLLILLLVVGVVKLVRRGA